MADVLPWIRSWKPWSFAYYWCHVRWRKKWLRPPAWKWAPTQVTQCHCNLWNQVAMNLNKSSVARQWIQWMVLWPNTVKTANREDLSLLLLLFFSGYICQTWSAQRDPLDLLLVPKESEASLGTFYLFTNCKWVDEQLVTVMCEQGVTVIIYHHSTWYGRWRPNFGCSGHTFWR